MKKLKKRPRSNKGLYNHNNDDDDDDDNNNNNNNQWQSVYEEKCHETDNSNFY
jgi:hypothetical protein